MATEITITHQDGTVTRETAGALAGTPSLMTARAYDMHRTFAHMTDSPMARHNAMVSWVRKARRNAERVRK